MTKNFTKYTMLAVAACTMAAGSAAAQSYKAEVPFAFRAGGKLMTAGSYSVSRSSGAGGITVLRLRNVDSGGGVLLTATSKTGERKGDPAPKLRFACAGTRCALAAMWVGGDEGAYRFGTPKLDSGETARVREVEIARVKAD